jgi:hypothetical protein
MKDIIVALELTVDSDMSDEAVKIFVEDAIRARVREITKITTFEIDPNLIDVTGISDGTIHDPTPPEWRIMPYRHV